ncbi:acyl-CoA carboxylase subunit epsilon [Naasia lichenicola]|uniref:Acyl-CoA carboxylase subunit epsilon n=1 Tax=Naasia lichenicola TaxID=2565933 RepID=A0A4S4FNN2_9MICO|nr:acyl-CoA carboxylase subunit epsilon [Naasia lichenicola]
MRSGDEPSGREPEETPVDVRVTSGVPTDEETAAVIAVLQALPRITAVSAPAAPSGWEQNRRSIRQPLHTSTWH